MRNYMWFLIVIVAAVVAGWLLNNRAGESVAIVACGAALEIGAGAMLIAFLGRTQKHLQGDLAPAERKGRVIGGVLAVLIAAGLIVLVVHPRGVDNRGGQSTRTAGLTTAQQARQKELGADMKQIGIRLQATTQPAERASLLSELEARAQEAKDIADADPYDRESARTYADIARRAHDSADLERLTDEIAAVRPKLARWRSSHPAPAETEPTTLATEGH
ncbi:MAG TPA: hypothetical protein VLJ39_04395 [Tepidisphaeraceae bacterium]|nr:hypothetical protein [Tepidisphaeraceae bacterium]